MPEVPNWVAAHFDSNDTATNRTANSVAGPSSSGLPPDDGQRRPLRFRFLRRWFCKPILQRAGHEPGQRKTAKRQYQNPRQRHIEEGHDRQNAQIHDSGGERDAGLRMLPHHRSGLRLPR